MATVEVDRDENPTELYTSICSERWDEAAAIVGSDPIQVKIWIVRHDAEDKSSILGRFLPLHTACARHAPESLVGLLLSAYPEAASIVDGQGFLPLHYACGNRANEGVINTLLIIYPDGAKLRDPVAGKLPLHHLSIRGPYSVGVIYFLLSIYPQAVQEKDNAGYTPVEIAKMANYPGRESVLNAYKPAAYIKSVKFEKHMESKGIIAQKELEDIQVQEKSIESAKKKIKIANEKNEQLRNKLQEECMGLERMVSLEHAKLNDATSTLESAQSDLKTMQTNRYNKKIQKMSGLDDIKKFDTSILSFRKQKRQAQRKCVVLQEKLKLKLEIHEDTSTKLQERLEGKREELDLCHKKVKTLESTLEQLNVDIKESLDAREASVEEAKYLNECKEIVNKVDRIEGVVNSLVSRYEPCKEAIIREENDFRRFNREREQKILEMAELEEKIAQIDHDQISQELRKQEKEIHRVMLLVQDIQSC